MSRRLLRRSHSIISVTKQGEMHQLCRNAKDILENWSKKFSVWVHLTFQHSCAGLGSVSQRLGPVLREVMGMGMPDLLQGSLLSDGPAGGKSVCLSQWRTEGCWKGGALTHYDTIPPPPQNTQTHAHTMQILPRISTALALLQVPRLFVEWSEAYAPKICRPPQASTPRLRKMKHFLNMPAWLPACLGNPKGGMLLDLRVMHGS